MGEVSDWTERHRPVSERQLEGNEVQPLTSPITYSHHRWLFNIHNSEIEILDCWPLSLSLRVTVLSSND